MANDNTTDRELPDLHDFQKEMLERLENPPEPIKLPSDGELYDIDEALAEAENPIDLLGNVAEVTQIHDETIVEVADVVDEAVIAKANMDKLQMLVQRHATHSPMLTPDQAVMMAQLELLQAISDKLDRLAAPTRNNSPEAQAELAVKIREFTASDTPLVDPEILRRGIKQKLEEVTGGPPQPHYETHDPAAPVLVDADLGEPFPDDLNDPRR